MNTHIPDGLPGLWVGFDAAVFLPGVKQAVILGFTRNTLLRRVFMYPGARTVGGALGNKP